MCLKIHAYSTVLHLSHSWTPPGPSMREKGFGAFLVLCTKNQYQRPHADPFLACVWWGLGERDQYNISCPEMLYPLQEVFLDTWLDFPRSWRWPHPVAPVAHSPVSAACSRESSSFQQECSVQPETCTYSLLISPL